MAAVRKKAAAKKVARKIVARKTARKKVAIKKPEPVGLKAQEFYFNFDEFPGCCQAEVVHNLSYYGPIPTPLTITKPQLDRLRERVLGETANHLVFAITDRSQEVWEFALKELGFRRQRRYQATTGSWLTAWVFTPEDQEPQEYSYDAYDGDF